MSSMNEAEVIIGGKVLKVSGYESQEYIQRVAAYLNNKLADFKNSDSFRKQPLDYQNIMIQLNIADDYFKAKAIADTLEGDLESKDKEIYDLKHELVDNQLELEKQTDEIRKLKKDIKEYQEAIIMLETGHRTDK